MNIKEYNNVKNMTYLEYCDYLQNKYGIGLYDYMTKSYNKNKKCTRTKEGLIAHHKMENHAILLCKKEFAMLCPFEWQLKENIVYCDYLEHLLLHTLICKYPEKETLGIVGIGGGGVNIICSELNDYYSGWKTKQVWRKTCLDKIEKDKKVYLLILKQFIKFAKYDECLIEYCRSMNYLCQSFNASFGNWDNKNNIKIYSKIIKLWKHC